MPGSRSLLNRVVSMIKWIRTSNAMNDEIQLPVSQISYHGVGASGVHWFPYGYHANIPAETLAIAFLLEANPESKILLAGSPLSRPPGLLVGEVSLYHPDTGSKVLMKNDGSVEVTAAKLRVVGDLEVTGATALGAVVTSSGQDISGTHTHAGSPTAPSGPVSTTGTPNS